MLHDTGNYLHYNAGAFDSAHNPGFLDKARSRGIRWHCSKDSHTNGQQIVSAGAPPADRPTNGPDPRRLTARRSRSADYTRHRPAGVLIRVRIICRVQRWYGSSKSQVVLKRDDICRFIADGELISKICFFYQNRSMAFFKNCVFVSDTSYISLPAWWGPLLNHNLIFFYSYCIVNKERSISIAKKQCKIAYMPVIVNI